MTFFDDLMNNEAVKANSDLCSSLQKTTKVVLSLANEAVDSEETEPQTSQEEASSRHLDASHTKDKEPDNTQQFEWMQEYPQDATMHDPQEVDDMANATSSLVPQTYKPQSAEPSSSQLSPQIFGNGWSRFHGDFIDTECAPSGYIDPSSFSFRLVERTLALAFSLLFSDEDLTSIQARSVFRWTYRSKSRDAHLCHLRWMLGPGRHNMWEAVDVPVNKHARVVSRAQNLLCGRHAGEVQVHGYVENEGPQEEMPDLLSAMEVQRKLEELNSRTVDGDTMEITIPKKAAAPSTTARGAFEAWSAFDPTADFDLYSTTALTLRLSISLLISNLAMTNVCVITGPAFQSAQLSRAVEASLTETPVEKQLDQPFFVL